MLMNRFLVLWSCCCRMCRSWLSVPLVIVSWLASTGVLTATLAVMRKRHSRLWGKFLARLWTSVTSVVCVLVLGSVVLRSSIECSLGFSYDGIFICSILWFWRNLPSLVRRVLGPTMEPRCVFVVPRD